MTIFSGHSEASASDPIGAGSPRHRRSSARKCRLLVAIASYGSRNLARLEKIIATYRRMSFETDVVVLSEAPKHLQADVEVVVGLPVADPWSLPFAHKQLFIDRRERYDLFIYSEDDMEVSEENIRAFLEMTPLLREDEIAGYLRVEMGPSGERSLPEAHGSAHWRPDSVRRRGEHVFAEFTNEHSAFYILTRSQLEAAIASGGFNQPPHAGKYDMLCSAATDPYTSCGFRKVVCISAMERFLIHHLSNRYAGALGTPWRRFKKEIPTLIEIAHQRHPITKLCKTESAVEPGRWSKRYDDFCELVLNTVPTSARSLLSIGSGDGRMEAEWLKRGITVTALPITSVKGALVEEYGARVVYGTLDECGRLLEEEQFDSVVLANLLHLQPRPDLLVRRCSRWLAPGGALIIKGPNFQLLPVLLKRLLRTRSYRVLNNFTSAGMTPLSIGTVCMWLRQAGVRPGSTQWLNSADHGDVSGALSLLQRLRNRAGRQILRRHAGRFTSDAWLLRAWKLGNCQSADGSREMERALQNAERLEPKM